MDRKTEISDHFIHAGAGTSLTLAWLGLIPGVIPLLAVTAVLVAVLVLPFLVLGLAAAFIAAPPYASWRLVRRGRNRRSHQGEQGPAAAPVPAPYSGTC
jgi:membrane protein implicated in regulation of membrane protease activity